MSKMLKKTRKGFSLVELVIAILIIAVLVAAVFAGGSIIIRNSQISRTTSDLHNFSIAVETWMNENPSLANVTKAADNYGTLNDGLVKALNSRLSEDYQLTKVADAAPTTNITTARDANSEVYESAKTDAWGNHYYVILTNDDRTAVGHSDFFVTVVSAGPNAKTAVNAAINEDDVFMLCQYTDGDVASAIYDYGDVNTQNAKLPRTNAETLTRATTYKGATTGAAGSEVYSTAPVVFSVTE